MWAPCFYKICGLKRLTPWLFQDILSHTYEIQVTGIKVELPKGYFDWKCVSWFCWFPILWCSITSFNRQRDGQFANMFSWHRWPAWWMIKSLSREQPDRPCSEPFVMKRCMKRCPHLCEQFAASTRQHPVFVVRALQFPDMLCSTMFCPYVHRLRWNMVERWAISGVRFPYRRTVWHGFPGRFGLRLGRWPQTRSMVPKTPRNWQMKRFGPVRVSHHFFADVKWCSRFYDPQQLHKLRLFIKRSRPLLQHHLAPLFCCCIAVLFSGVMLMNYGPGTGRESTAPGIGCSAEKVLVHRMELSCDV